MMETRRYARINRIVQLREQKARQELADARMRHRQACEAFALANEELAELEPRTEKELEDAMYASRRDARAPIAILSSLRHLRLTHRQKIENQQKKVAELQAAEQRIRSECEFTKNSFFLASNDLKKSNCIIESLESRDQKKQAGKERESEEELVGIKIHTSTNSWGQR